jgi:hypothetical protein
VYTSWKAEIKRVKWGSSWSWSHGSWIYYYICNQYLSPLTLWVTCRKSQINFITYCCIEYTSPWSGIKLTTLVVIGTDCIYSNKSNCHTITTTNSFRSLLLLINNITDCHDITEILLKVALNTIPAPFIAILLSSTWIYQVTCSNKSSVLDINKKLLQYQQYVSCYCRIRSRPRWPPAVTGINSFIICNKLLIYWFSCCSSNFQI